MNIQLGVKSQALSKLMILVFCLLWAGGIFADDKAEKKVIVVTVKPLSELVVNQHSSVPASVIGINQPILSSQISALVNKINVDTGDYVKKGSVLVELDCRDYQHALQQSRASLLSRKAQAAFADKTYKRNKRLIKQSTIPQNSLDQSEADHLAIQADLSALQSQLKRAELTVERCRITAPFSGQIIKRMVQKGQLVSPATPLLELLETSNLQVSAELSHEQVKGVKRAAQVMFKANGVETKLTLHKVVDLIKENTRTQEVRFKLAEKNALVVGTAGRVIWKDTQAKLPANYVSLRDGKLGVLILQADKKTVQFVALTGTQEGQAADIDLPLDTLIIDNGRINVKDKQVVDVK